MKLVKLATTAPPPPPPPPGRLRPSRRAGGKKLCAEGGGGGMIEMYNIYPCSDLETVDVGPEDKIGKEVADFDSRGALDIDTSTDMEVMNCIVYTLMDL